MPMFMVPMFVVSMFMAVHIIRFPLHAKGVRGEAQHASPSHNFSRAKEKPFWLVSVLAALLPGPTAPWSTAPPPPPPSRVDCKLNILAAWGQRIAAVRSRRLPGRIQACSREAEGPTLNDHSHFPTSSIVRQGLLGWAGVGRSRKWRKTLE